MSSAAVAAVVAAAAAAVAAVVKAAVELLYQIHALWPVAVYPPSFFVSYKNITRIGFVR